MEEGYDLVTCVMCGAEAELVLGRKSNWRMIQLDGVRYYACPDEFAENDASLIITCSTPAPAYFVEKFSGAYQRVLRRILEIHAKA